MPSYEIRGPLHSVFRRASHWPLRFKAELAASQWHGRKLSPKSLHIPFDQILSATSDTIITFEPLAALPTLWYVHTLFVSLEMLRS